MVMKLYYPTGKKKEYVDNVVIYKNRGMDLE